MQNLNCNRFNLSSRHRSSHPTLASDQRFPTIASACENRVYFADSRDCPETPVITDYELACARMLACSDVINFQDVILPSKRAQAHE